MTQRLRYRLHTGTDCRLLCNLGVSGSKRYRERRVLSILHTTFPPYLIYSIVSVFLSVFNYKTPLSDDRLPGKHPNYLFIFIYYSWVKIEKERKKKQAAQRVHHRVSCHYRLLVSQVVCNYHFIFQVKTVCGSCVQSVRRRVECSLCTANEKANKVCQSAWPIRRKRCQLVDGRDGIRRCQ